MLSSPKPRPRSARALCASSASRRDDRARCGAINWIWRLTLFQFELDELYPRRSDITHPAHCALLLPVEVAEPQPLAAVGSAGHDLGNLAAVDDDPEAGPILGDRFGRLARLEYEPPAASPLVVEQLRVAGNVARHRREAAGLRLQQRYDDVVERRGGDIGRLVREGLLGIGGEAHVAARAGPCRRRLLPKLVSFISGRLN